MSYIKKPFSGDLEQYVDDELNAIQEALSQSDATTLINLKKSFKEPARPRDTMIVVADGTHWDPGSGKGLYIYEGGSWKLVLSL